MATELKQVEMGEASSPQSEVRCMIILEQLQLSALNGKVQWAAWNRVGASNGVRADGPLTPDNYSLATIILLGSRSRWDNRLPWMSKGRITMSGCFVSN